MSAIRNWIEARKKAAVAKQEAHCAAVIERLNELVDDAIDALNADMETGSHWMNNAAGEKWEKSHRRYSKARAELHAYIRMLRYD